MNEEIVAKFVEEMLRLLQNAEAFAGAQLPEICKEVLWYNRIIAGIWMILSPLMVYGVYAVWPHLLGRCDKIRDSADRELVKGIAGIVMVLIGGIFFTAFFVNLENLIKVLVAPRLYLVEYFAGLIS